MRAGDRVLILCEVTEADDHSFTMIVNACVYQHCEKVVEITEVDVLIQDRQCESRHRAGPQA